MTAASSEETRGFFFPSGAGIGKKIENKMVGLLTVKAEREALLSFVTCCQVF